MFHTHITWQDIRRGKGHVCVRRWSLATEDVFLFKIDMFTSQEIIRAGGHMCGWLWGSEARRAPTKCILAQPGAATGLLSFLIFYEIVRCTLFTMIGTGVERQSLFWAISPIQDFIILRDSFITLPHSVSLHNEFTKALFLLSGQFLRLNSGTSKQNQIFRQNMNKYLIGCCFVLCCQTSPIFEAFVGKQ